MRPKPPEHKRAGGGRSLPETPGDDLIYLIHTATYQWAGGSVAGKDVLNNGMWEGVRSRPARRPRRSVMGSDVASDRVDDLDSPHGHQSGEALEGRLEEKRWAAPV